MIHGTTDSAYFLKRKMSSYLESQANSVYGVRNKISFCHECFVYALTLSFFEIRQLSDFS